MNRLKTIIPYLITFISPVIGIIPSLRLIYLNNIHGYILLAFIMAMFSFLWPPLGDLYRYSLDYNDMLLNDGAGIIYFDPIYPLLLKSFIFMNFSFGSIRAITTFILYCIFFYLIIKITDNNEELRSNNRYKFRVFMIFLLSIEIMGFITAVRFNIATVFFALGFYFAFFTKHKLNGNLLILLSILTHFSFFIVAFILYCSKFLVNKLYFYICIILTVLVILIKDEILAYILIGDIISPDFTRHLNFYIDSDFKFLSSDEHSTRYKISRYISISLYFFAIFYLIRHKISLIKFHTIYSLMFLCALVFTFEYVFFRYAYITFVLFLIVFFVNFSKPKDTISFKLIFIVSILVYLSSIYASRELIVYGNQNLIVYPVPYILLNEYSQSWIDDNVLTTGDIVRSPE